MSSGHSGEVLAGGCGVLIAINSISGIGGSAGEVPARDVPGPIVSGVITPVVLPAGEVPARVPVSIVGGRIPPGVRPVGEVPVRATAGGRHAAPPGVGGIHPLQLLTAPHVTFICGSVI